MGVIYWIWLLWPISSRNTQLWIQTHRKLKLKKPGKKKVRFVFVCLLWLLKDMNNQVFYIDLWRTYLYISLIVIDSKCDKGDLILESYSLWLKFQKKVPKSQPVGILKGQQNSAQDSDLSPFFGIWGKVKNFLRLSHL